MENNKKWTKGFLIIIISLISLLIIYIVPIFLINSAFKKPGWKLHNSILHNYKIEYPNDWVKNNNFFQSKTDITFFKNQKINSALSAVECSVAINKEKNNGLSLENWIKHNYNAENNIEQLTLPFKINNGDAIRVRKYISINKDYQERYDNISPYLLYSFDQVYYKNGNDIYKFHLFNQFCDNDEFQNLATEMLKNFKIKRYYLY